MIIFGVVYLYFIIVMKPTSESAIKKDNLIEEWKVLNLIVVENYVGPTPFTIIVIVSVTNIVTITV